MKLKYASFIDQLFTYLFCSIFYSYKSHMFYTARHGWRAAVMTAQNIMSPNGRLYAKQGRGRPGRAPCLGEASAAASVAPRPLRIPKAAASYRHVSCSTKCATYFRRAERPEGEARAFNNDLISK
jgi:hypothetical protein